MAAAEERVREGPVPAEMDPTIFRRIVETVRDYAIFFVSREGRVLTWNTGAELIKGYRPHEIIGESISRFYGPEDRSQERPQRLLERAAREGRVEDEGWRIRKDGTRFWADVVICAVRGHEGELLGFTKVTRDLTERRRAEEALRQSEERFRLLVESIQDYAIFMLDPSGYVATWNPGAQRIKGYRAQEIIGQHFSRFYPLEDVEAGKCERELEVASRDGRYEDEGWRLRKDGTRFWASVVITALRNPNGKLVAFAKITRDLTERRRLEEERVRSAQAQEAVRLRDEFLSIASHELKTPLTAIQLQLQGLLEDHPDLDNRFSRKVQRASHSTQRLTELVETLLDVSRIATGRFDLQPVPVQLREVVDDIVDRLGDSAARAGCELRISVPADLTGTWDRLRLEQVLINLTANAIKYAAHAPIEITGSSEGERIRIEVRDYGPGVPEADLERIFGRFERAASVRHFGGLGLGLFVSQQIVDAHGGKVHARNMPDRGATFTVELPREPPRGDARNDTPS